MIGRLRNHSEVCLFTGAERELPHEEQARGTVGHNLPQVAWANRACGRTMWLLIVLAVVFQYIGTY